MEGPKKEGRKDSEAGLEDGEKKKQTASIMDKNTTIHRQFCH